MLKQSPRGRVTPLSAKVALTVFTLCVLLCKASSYSIPHNWNRQKTSKSIRMTLDPSQDHDEKEHHGTASAVLDERQPEYDETTGKLLRTPTRMMYVEPSTERALLRRDTDGFDSEITQVSWHEGDVWVQNGRATTQEDSDFGTLHENGFQLLENKLSDRTLDFLSKKEVTERYYPECERLLQTFLKSQTQPQQKVRVQAFDHNIRQQQEESDSKTETQAPIALVHGDYTTASAPRRIQLLAEPPRANDSLKDRLGDTPLVDAEIAHQCTTIGNRRYALINIWRNIDKDHPVLSVPLACVDASSVVDPDDLRVLELRYTDRIGENYLVCPAPDRHRWVYYPEMTLDEVLLIKQWDSDSTVPARFSLHSAFDDPSSPQDAPRRQSIEVRCVVTWESAEQ